MNSLLQLEFKLRKLGAANEDGTVLQLHCRSSTTEPEGSVTAWKSRGQPQAAGACNMRTAGE